MTNKIQSDMLPAETAQQLADQPEEFDLDAIRLSQNFGESSGIKKLLTTVPVRKPNRTQFFRTHPDHRLDVMLLKYGDTDDLYIVMPQLRAEVEHLAKPYRLVLTVDRGGTVFIWPLAIPDEERPLDWHSSAMEADAFARESWVRMQSNQSLGAYEIFQAQGQLSEPAWPVETWPELVKVAFRKKIIDAADHVVLRKLRGEL